MRACKPTPTAEPTDAPAPGHIVTTLYDLIEALHAQVTPGEDDLVIAAMKNIMNTRQLTFIDLPHTHRVKVA
ncbi:MAG: hypothetical protein ETSY1_28660 [Candidatus Entotheonella factor]|uniref:Uncharacterized protein n=1 Tax=Entotheonella factor TaxID=1429438 RepID=W4LE05_ENTF1|nr:hypothetical protein [Candidatus Entotheonella palauensis]ETW95930.1 MAG: hypothetical protein ETSY1_28660 [Candidatus Entotheonella factor]